MPTHEEDRRFWAEYDRLTPDQQVAFADAVETFVTDLRRGSFRKGLRVKRLQGSLDIWEMIWAADGRATFSFGQSKSSGDPHIVWHRIGSHDIFKA